MPDILNTRYPFTHNFDEILLELFKKLILIYFIFQISVMDMECPHFLPEWTRHSYFGHPYSQMLKTII